MMSPTLLSTPLIQNKVLQPRAISVAEEEAITHTNEKEVTTKNEVADTTP
jgi:hypothetical protein